VLVDLSVAASGGAATYSAGFARGLVDAHDPDLDRVVVLLDHGWARAHQAAVADLVGAGARVVVERFPPPGTWRARLLRGRMVARLVRHHRIDVAYFPRDAAPRLPVPTVVLLNNRYAWASFATGQAIGGRLPALLLRGAARLTARRAAAVLAVSETMGAVAHGVPIDAVVHHGCSLPEHPREPVASGDGPRRVQVLMIGNLIENKRAEVVIEGVAAARRRGGDWDLRVYGTRMDPDYADRVEALSRRELGENVLRPPVDQAELVVAYQRADILVMGGAFESFCHPLVEGMRSGCVVVAPDTSLVREICGDVAVTYRDGDPAALARALEQAAAEQDERSRRGVERSRAFDWVTAAERTLGAVRSAAVPTGGRARSPGWRGRVPGARPAPAPPASLAAADRERARVLIGLTVAPPGGAATYVAGFASGLAAADIAHKDQILAVFDAGWAGEHADLVAGMRAADIEVVAQAFPPPGTWRARLGRGSVLRGLGRRAGVQAAFFPREVAPSMPVPVAVLARNLYAWLPFASGAPIGGPVPAFILRVMARRSASRAAAVLAVSAQIAQYVSPAPVTEVIHHGCLLPEHPRPERTAVPDPTIVLTIGNLTENKGIDTVVRGVADVRRRDDRGWDLRVHGKRSDPAYAGTVEALSVDLLGASVLCGPAYGDDLVAAYQAADIVVVGTTFESFCHPLVEAMRSGCAVVAPAGLLVDEICGDVAVTYTEHDPDSLARALLVARAELDDRSRRGIGRARAFTWERTAAQTVAAVRAVAVPRARG
jgi:glycosyltransferase involved in cell wall biosynthesis